MNRMLDDADIAAYTKGLIEALRSTDPVRLRAFAELWGKRLSNRGLQQLAKASEEAIERRMWLMIRDRPDLSDLHLAAEAWLAGHPAEESR